MSFRSKLTGTIGKAAVLGIWSLVVLIPILVIVLNSLKTMSELQFSPIKLPEAPQFFNYSKAFIDANMLQAIGNSILITSLSVICVILLASMAAFPLARVKSRWSGFLYLYFLSGIMVPFQLAMVPLYKLLNELQLKGTHLGVVFIYTASALPFAIFLYAAFLRTIPKDLEESAMIDGCGLLRTFWSILFPLVKPITSTLVITNSLFIWNDFFIPLLFIQSKGSRTVPLTLYSFTSNSLTEWPLVFAAVVIASLPLIALFLALQKQFIAGIAGGAVKG